jgi:hypothetical protein
MNHRRLAIFDLCADANPKPRSSALELFQCPTWIASNHWTWADPSFGHCLLRQLPPPPPVLQSMSTYCTLHSQFRRSSSRREARRLNCDLAKLIHMSPWQEGSWLAMSIRVATNNASSPKASQAAPIRRIPNRVLAPAMRRARTTTAKPARLGPSLRICPSRLRPRHPARFDHRSSRRDVCTATAKGPGEKGQRRNTNVW